MPEEDLKDNSTFQKTAVELIEAALAARGSAYAPYSGYQVGAALLTGSGRIYRGCNIENASFGATNCAERTAFFKAVSEGEENFLAIAISGGLQDKLPMEYAYPCGICRQVMKEFAGDDFQIIIAKGVNEYKVYTLADMLPFGFGGGSIQ